MPDSPQTSCDIAQPESNTRAADGQVYLLSEHSASSPREYIAFTILDAVDWIRGLFNRLIGGNSANEQTSPTIDPADQLRIAAFPSPSGKTQIPRSASE